MEWIYNLKSKMTVAILLFSVLGLVIVINFSERNNSTKINNAISSIYEDRLVVESYIFQYVHHFQSVAEIAENPEYSADQKHKLIATPLSKINSLNELYWKTKLTDAEKLSFTKFADLCKNISAASLSSDFVKTKQLAKEATHILHDLSSIQVSEAKLQMENVNSLYNFSTLSSHFEIAILIIIALIIQALVFSSKAINSIKAPKQFNLN